MIGSSIQIVPVTHVYVVRQLGEIASTTGLYRLNSINHLHCSTLPCSSCGMQLLPSVALTSSTSIYPVKSPTLPYKYCTVSFRPL